jgi:hypothetical protein
MPSIPPYESEFWDKGLECMKPADRERLIVKKLKHLLKYAYDNSLYYHETFKSIGLDIDSINSLDRMAFFWGIGNDFFLEIARMRAARRLWYRITRGILKKSSNNY